MATVTEKSLSYSISSKINVLDIEDSIKSKIQVTFESKQIQDLYLIVIKFINSGNTPIQPSDYYKALSIDFNGSAEILSVEILDQYPRNLGIVPVHTSQNVEIPKVLLNQKDSFELKVLVTNFQGLSVDGRIAGVRSIQERDSSTLEAYSKAVAVLVAIAITSFSGYFINQLPSSPGLKSGELIIVMLASTLAAFASMGTETLTALTKNIKKKK